MKKITPELIRSFEPCYDPSQYLSEDYEATVLEFLNHPEIPVKDKFWMVLREDFIDAKTLRLFALWCARQVIKFAQNPHPNSINAVNVAKRYANGDATEDDLSEAVAWAAEREASVAAARAAARAANSAVAWDAVAWDAERNASVVAARDAAWKATWKATMAAQLKQLISMIENPTLS